MTLQWNGATTVTIGVLHQCGIGARLERSGGKWLLPAAGHGRSRAWHVAAGLAEIPLVWLSRQPAESRPSLGPAMRMWLGP